MKYEFFKEIIDDLIEEIELTEKKLFYVRK